MPRLSQIPGHRRLRSCAAFVLLALGFTGPASALHIVLTNDDGFESRNLQVVFTALKAAGHEVVVSAPYRDQSGASAILGSMSKLGPTLARSPGGTIAAGAPGIGPTTLAADQYYVDSTPVAAALYGIDVAALAKWGAAPDLVISGPNIGNNLGVITPHSGTVGATIAVLNRGLPAIAVSGANGDATTAPLLAEITLRIVAALESRGKINLPVGIGLNVNAPPLDSKRTAASYRLAFTQIGGPSTVVRFVTQTGEYPGIAATPATASPSVVDSNPMSESTAIGDGNTITISPIQGTYQAPPDQAALVLAQLRPVISSAIAVVNPKMINLASRAVVGTGGNVQIAGFVLSGRAAKTLLIRASGPALAQFGVGGTLVDPLIELYDRNNQLIATNDNWSDDPVKAAAISAAAAKAGAFAWPAGSKDAALLVTLTPGPYTAIVKGVGDTTGVAILEAFDAEFD